MSGAELSGLIGLCLSVAALLGLGALALRDWRRRRREERRAQRRGLRVDDWVRRRRGW